MTLSFRCTSPPQKKTRIYYLFLRPINPPLKKTVENPLVLGGGCSPSPGCSAASWCGDLVVRECITRVEGSNLQVSGKRSGGNGDVFFLMFFFQGTRSYIQTTEEVTQMVYKFQSNEDVWGVLLIFNCWSGCIFGRDYLVAVSWRIPEKINREHLFAGLVVSTLRSWP